MASGVPYSEHSFRIRNGTVMGQHGGFVIMTKALTGVLALIWSGMMALEQGAELLSLKTICEPETSGSPHNAFTDLILPPFTEKIRPGNLLC